MQLKLVALQKITLKIFLILMYLVLGITKRLEITKGEFAVSFNTRIQTVTVSW